MSRIRRLEIQGIRNFGPGEDGKKAPTIHFSHPLTLILGPNGTGKTTIIEALKYATTGDFPPGSSGKSNSFIHDPLLTNESSVRGLVKAEIVDTKGHKVTVSRRIELVQKKFVKKFQTLDSTLSRIDKDTGQPKSISHRCADLDMEMGLALGVSKPILNYVIFCHQEDSTWPLEDGKKLKERFDQIFDSDKYNKAEEKIRKYNTALKGNLRAMKGEKNGFKVVLEEAEEKKKSLDQCENRLGKSVKKVAEIMGKISPLTEKIRKLCNTENSYMKLNADKASIKKEYALLNEQINELKKSIKILHKGTTEDLYKEIQEFDSILLDMEDDMGILKNKLKDITAEERRLKVIVGDQQLTIGKLKQQAQAQERNIATRNRTLEEMLPQWGLGEVGDEISETEASVYFDRLKEKLFQMETDIKDTVLKHQAVEKQLQKDLDDSRDQKSKLESEKVMLNKQIAEKRKEASRMRMQIDEVNTLASKLELVDSKVKQAEEKVVALAGSFNADEMNKGIDDEIKKRDRLEVSLDKVNKEVTLLQQQSSLQAELDLLKASLTAKEKDIQKLINKHQDTLKILLNVEVLPERDMKRALSGVQEKLTEQIKGLNNRIQREQREITSLETTKKHQERELQEKNSELEGIQDRIASLCHGRDYDEVLQQAQKAVRELEDTRGMYKYKGVAYKLYIEKTNSCCPLCHRDFTNQQDLAEFISELNDEVNKYPNKLKTCEEQLEVQEKRYKSLLQLDPFVKTATKLEEDMLETLKNEVVQTKRKLSESHTRIENLQLELAEPESKLAQCKDIVGDVALWDQYLAEVIKLNQSITRVKSSLPNQVGDKSMQEAQAEQESLRESVSSVRKNIEVLRSSVNSHNDKLQNAKETKNRLVEEQFKMTSEVQKLKQLQDKLKDFNSEETSLQENVQELQKQIGPINQQLEARDRMLQRTKKEHEETLEKERNTISRKSQSLHDLKKVQSEIDESIRHGVVDLLRRSETDMKKYQIKLEEFEKNVLDISTKINNIMSEISKKETRKRDMEDNMMLKRKIAEAEILQQKIAELRAQLGGMNYRELIEKKERLNEEQEQLVREKNLEQGSQDEIERNIKQLKNELNEGKYRLALRNYINICAAIEVHEEAINNLVAYTAALDKAIIEYHEERMASVNKIIQNLWELIYKGKDTTSIRIQTESTEGIGDKRRTYNYKVVQEKQKVSMDMKGRCSAGQKVLASLIIRLALAETFAKNCGIFALDEPTTNLDVPNMNSLAQALAKIVTIRSKHQKNFQLIVISHDESFVKQLTKVDKVRKIYELYRNGRGLTEIRVVCTEDPNLGAMASGSNNQELSGEEEDAETASRSRKRRQLAETRERLLKNDLSISPPRKKRITKTDG